MQIGGDLMNHISLEDLLDRILCADSGELFQILDAAAERFSELFPDRELLTFTAEGSSPDSQIALLQSAMTLLASTKK